MNTEWKQYHTSNTDWECLWEYDMGQEYILIGNSRKKGWIVTWITVNWLPMEGVTSLEEAKAVGMAMWRMR